MACAAFFVFGAFCRECGALFVFAVLAVFALFVFCARLGWGGFGCSTITSGFCVALACAILACLASGTIFGFGTFGCRVTRKCTYTCTQECNDRHTEYDLHGFPHKLTAKNGGLTYFSQYERIHSDPIFNNPISIACTRVQIKRGGF
jgi:hypothetical protein